MYGNEGGFGVTPSSTGQEKKPFKRSQNIVPVTVKQIIEAPEEGLTVAGLESNLVRLVGIIRSVESSSLKTVYKFEDTTGAISIVNWNKDDEPDRISDIDIKENEYYRVVGTIRNIGGQKQVMALDIRPIKDVAEITEHQLEIIYIGLKDEEYNKAGDVVVKSEPLSYNGEMSGVGGTVANHNPQAYYDTSSSGLNFNPTQQKVFTVIQQSNDENGITPQDIYDAIPTKMPMKDISNILEWLVNEGHVYTAIDENHYKSTY